MTISLQEVTALSQETVLCWNPPCKNANRWDRDTMWSPVILRGCGLVHFWTEPACIWMQNLQSRENTSVSEVFWFPLQYGQITFESVLQVNSLCKKQKRWNTLAKNAILEPIGYYLTTTSLICFERLCLFHITKRTVNNDQHTEEEVSVRYLLSA